MGREINYLAAVLLLVCVTGISGDVVIVKPANRSITVVEEDDVVFECKHPPTEDVEWFLSGMTINRTAPRNVVENDIQKTADGNVISRLTVNDIVPREEGVYKCSNTNREESLFDNNQSDEVNVKVIKLGAEVHIKGPTYVIVTRGSDLLLECTGERSADLVWNFKEISLSNNLNVILNTEDNSVTDRKKLKLTVSRVTADDDGQYTCQDKVNRKNASVQIKVDQSNGGCRVHWPSTLLSRTLFTSASIVLAMSF